MCQAGNYPSTIRAARVYKTHRDKQDLNSLLAIQSLLLWSCFEKKDSRCEPQQEWLKLLIYTCKIAYYILYNIYSLYLSPDFGFFKKTYQIHFLRYFSLFPYIYFYFYRWFYRWFYFFYIYFASCCMAEGYFPLYYIYTLSVFSVFSAFYSAHIYKNIYYIP